MKCDLIWLQVKAILFALIITVLLQYFYAAGALGRATQRMSDFYKFSLACKVAELKLQYILAV